MRQERGRQDIDRLVDLRKISRALHQVDQSAVDVLHDLVDGHVLGFEPVYDRRQARVGLAQMREDGPVFKSVVTSDDRAVGSAVRAERPVVLPHRHLADRLAGVTDPEGALLDLAEKFAYLAEFAPQVITHLRQVLADRPAVAGVDVAARRGRRRRACRLVPERATLPQRRA